MIIYSCPGIKICSIEVTDDLKFLPFEMNLHQKLRKAVSIWTLNTRNKVFDGI